MDFKDLQRANAEIKTTNIRGKDYAEVPQRIKAFRMLYPDGFIHTEMLSNENGLCVFRAEAGYYEEVDGGFQRIVLGIGHAYEKENAGQVNRTSYIENCETSAVGRCLGMIGLGIDVSVASYEEVSNAIYQQEKAKFDDQVETEAAELATEKERLRMRGLCKENGIDPKWIVEQLGIEKGKMTKRQYVDALNLINDEIRKKEKGAE